jgi:hypothetical protein
VVEGAPLLREYTGNGIEGSNPFVSATIPREPVLRLRLIPNFLVVFKGYSRWAVECGSGGLAGNGSLTPDILQSCCLNGFWFSSVMHCKTTVFQAIMFWWFDFPRARFAGLVAELSDQFIPLSTSAHMSIRYFRSSASEDLIIRYSIPLATAICCANSFLA